MPTTLSGILDKFALDVNGNEQIHRITKNWTVEIAIECVDKPDRYRLQVVDGTIQKISDGNSGHTFDDDQSITLRSDEACLSAIFSGKRNPALANIDGDLLVYGDERHSTRLDAIALILWGFH
ncbi:MAG: hypothetical protein WA987_11625 [Cellvibrio sp.]